jgi:hypothetical protein
LRLGDSLLSGQSQIDLAKVANPLPYGRGGHRLPVLYADIVTLKRRGKLFVGRLRYGQRIQIARIEKRLTA